MQKGDIKWVPLWRELKNCQPAWKHQSLKTFLIGFILAIVKLGLSCSDLGGDINLSYDYIHGHTYIYLFANESGELITSLDCKFLNETHLSPSGDQTPMYACFAQDTGFGYVTLASIFTPGTVNILGHRVLE